MSFRLAEAFRRRRRGDRGANLRRAAECYTAAAAQAGEASLVEWAVLRRKTAEVRTERERESESSDFTVRAVFR